jgi:hypothetical protein
VTSVFHCSSTTLPFIESQDKTAHQAPSEAIRILAYCTGSKYDRGRAEGVLKGLKGLKEANIKYCSTSSLYFVSQN